jgi:hypothetical protein
VATGAVIARIITQYTDKGSKAARRDIMKLGKDFDKFAGKATKAFGLAAAASAAFAVKIGVDAVKGAMEDQKQQIALATALRNTTGATNEAIAATVTYLDKLELLVGVDNNQLIPSLQILTQATKDVTQAQALQSLALDISAGTTKDLASVSLALAKAIGGNVGALTRLGVPLDADAVKAKDLNAILKSLGETFAGQAEQRAGTFEFRLIKLQLAFNQIIDQIGYALIPILEEFAEYISANVLPVIQEWVSTNKDELAKGLKDVGTTLVAVGKSLAGFFKTIYDNIDTVKLFASIFIGAKLATGIYSVVTAVLALRTALLAQAAAGVAAGTGLAFATAGISAGAAAVAVGAFVVASGAAFIAINKLTGATDKTATATDKVGTSTQAYNSHLKELGKVGEQVAATNFKNRKIILGTVKTTKDLTAAEKKAAEMRAAIKKAGLDVFGVKNVSDTDPIQLEAARLNLLKQNNLEEQRRLEAIIENMNAQLMANQAIQRYVDLLGVVADQEISPEEVILLGLKWGISQEAVVAYTTAIFAVNDSKLSTSEIDLLAKQWGVTKQQAEMYLDFFKAINDGKLDQSEVNALMEKWKLTSKEVTDYAKKIADGVVPSDLWPTPGNQAAKSWSDALAALNAYITAASVKLAPTAPTLGGGDSFAPVSGFTAGVYGKNTPYAPSAEDLETIFGAIPKLDSTSMLPPSADFLAGISGSTEGIAQSGAGTIVNVTVQGSVTTDKDLVTAIRDGLLQGQNSGFAVFKDATAI